jgi:hypothetical protein
MAETSTIDCESREFAAFALSGCTRIWKYTLLYGKYRFFSGKNAALRTGDLICAKIQIRQYGEQAAKFSMLQTSTHTPQMAGADLLGTIDARSS